MKKQLKPHSLVSFLLLILSLLSPAFAANEIQATAPTGRVLYAEVISQVGSASGQVWATGNTFAAVTNTALIAQTIPMTEQGTTGLYLGSFPAGITTPGSYLTLVYTRAGASPAIGDALSGSGGLDWTGATLASEGVTQNSTSAIITTQGTQGTTLAAVTAKTTLIATNAADSPNEVTSQGQATTLLLSLATYQSTLTTGSTTTALNTALTGTADLTGGKVVFTAGVNKGVARTIASMNSGTGAITLLSAVPTTPGATDAFSVVQGSKALEQFLAGLGTDSRPVLSANAQPNIGITNALPALDGSNRVLLQPVQTGVTIPTVTALTNPVVASSVTGAVGSVTAPVVASSVTGAVGSVTGAVGSVTASVVASSVTAPVVASSVTGAVGSVTGSVGSISGITFPANFGTFSVDTSGRVTLVPGQSTVASNFAAAPTAAQNAAAITFPATVAVNNFPATVVASNLPADYQQRAVAVTLPTTAPAGYGGAGGGSMTVSGYAAGQDPATLLASQLAAIPAAAASALMTKTVSGTGLTLGQEFVLLGLSAVKVGSITNTWNAATHILTTAYATTTGTIALTTTAQYPSTQVTNPALSSVSGALGTVPQP